MDFLKSQFLRIQQQLGGLNASQRMLAASLVVIMLMTLFWWTTIAGKSETEVLIDTAMSTEEMGRITSVLNGKRIPARIVNDRIQVPSELKMDAMAVLAYEHAMPADTENAIQKMLSSMNPLASSFQTDKMFNEAKGRFLADIMRHMPSVTYSAVVLDPVKNRGPGGTKGSATVFLKTSDEKPVRSLVNAVADLVAGSCADVAREKVSITINEKSYTAKSRDGLGGGGDDVLAQMQDAEAHFIQGLSAQFSFIPNAQISVRVSLNNDRVETTKHSVDPKAVLVKPISEDSSTEDQQTLRKNDPEPGVVPNGPMAVEGSSSAGGERSQGVSERNRTQNFIDTTRTDEHRTTIGGEPSILSGVLLVPRSYFIDVYKSRNKTDKEPPEDRIETFIQAKIVELRKSFKTALAVESENAVYVNTYDDVAHLLPAATSASVAPSSFSLLLTGHMKEIALAVLAMVSLFMVSNIVKKTTPAPAVTAPAPAKAAIAMMGAPEEPVGEATNGSTMLDGMELDEESVKAQQMLEQVADMVGDNPDAAANLVKRWLNRS